MTDVPTLTQFNLAETDDGYLLEVGGSDGAVVRVAADLVCVMERGKVVEQGTVDEIFANPTQEYTKRLLDAIPGASIPLGGGVADGL